MHRHLEYRLRVERIGAEAEPLCIVDNFVSDPESLRELAMQGRRPAPDAGLYPGIRAPAPEAYCALLADTLTDLAGEVFGIRPAGTATLDSFFSMVSIPPSQLKPAQRIPHFDQPRQTDLAVMHYLCGPEHGGTSFYRHRSSRFEYVDELRMPGYHRKLEAEFREHGLPEPPAYICGDTELFERIHTVDAAWNRMAVYRTSSLHSGDIAPGYSFDTNPLTGRFTIASFWRTGL